MNHPIQLKNRSNRLDVAWTRNSRVKETRACRGKSTPRGNILPSGPVDIRQGRATEEVGAVLPPCVPHEWRGRSGGMAEWHPNRGMANVSGTSVRCLVC